MQTNWWSGQPLAESECRRVIGQLHSSSPLVQRLILYSRPPYNPPLHSNTRYMTQIVHNILPYTGTIIELQSERPPQRQCESTVSLLIGRVSQVRTGHQRDANLFLCSLWHRASVPQFAFRFWPRTQTVPQNNRLHRGVAERIHNCRCRGYLWWGYLSRGRVDNNHEYLFWLKAHCRHGECQVGWS